MFFATSSSLVLSIASLITGLAGQAAADDRVIEPFNGKNLAGWKIQGPAINSKWTVGTALVDLSDPTRLVLSPATAATSGSAEMVNVIPRRAHSQDIYTVAKFGSATIDLEFMVPKGSNSGVYLMGEYEIQVLDSFGEKKLHMGSMGAIYAVKPPSVNATAQPGRWQTLSIEFIVPKFEDGKKVADLKVIKIVLNGKVIQENVVVPKPTGGGLTGEEHAEGPLMFQGNHGPGRIPKYPDHAKEVEEVVRRQPALHCPANSATSRRAIISVAGSSQSLVREGPAK
jgi:hypothetical protein